jgi:signal transduction histidine kinase
MKIFVQGILARRKIILIFLLAILLPSLIVGYLSLSTFAKRREVVRKILESNLWISGEATLKSFEARLLEYEEQALKAENFISLIQRESSSQGPFSFPINSKQVTGQAFLLDADYQIIFPRTGSEDVSVFHPEKSLLSSKFSQDFQRAEVFEFGQKNYRQAAELYKQCSASASSEKDRAMALEGLGRCLLSLKDYEEAYKVYSELSAKHGQLKNNAGHPYGIGAEFQLFEIEKHRGKEEQSLKILLDLFQRIRNGNWLLGSSSYNFFVADIESILSEKLNEKFPEIKKTYNALRESEAPYLQALFFTDFLKKEAVPRIKEKDALSRRGEERQPERFFAVRQEANFFLISYRLLPDIQPKKTLYGGYCWRIDYFKKDILPKILGETRENSGLQIQVVDESGQNVLSGKRELAAKDSLSLSFRQFPLPWKLLVSQASFKELERTAVRENVLYGMLLSVIVVLMLLGVVLIIRDISRESETTRLRTEFVHNVSHELKTPLTLVRLYSETLQRKEDLEEEEKQEAYEIITKESERLSHLINNVLDFSRIEMGRKEFNFKKGNLSDVVRDTLDSYRYHLEKKGFNIQADIAPDLPEINFDREAMASVLVNLLSNAMKFSQERKEVAVRLFKEKNCAVLQVEDKGIGISPKEISKIFKRFYRVKDKVSAETGGSGLGLTLIKHITEAHSGRVKVESQPGEGSIFSVILPFPSVAEE